MKKAEITIPYSKTQGLDFWWTIVTDLSSHWFLKTACVVFCGHRCSLLVKTLEQLWLQCGCSTVSSLDAAEASEEDWARLLTLITREQKMFAWKSIKAFLYNHVTFNNIVAATTCIFCTISPFMHRCHYTGPLIKSHFLNAWVLVIQPIYATTVSSHTLFMCFVNI